MCLPGVLICKRDHRQCCWDQRKLKPSRISDHTQKQKFNNNV
uniref:Uncharacterized protein n=1 Tax=Arundo donax TaxID=35708 RepID=A0A0A9EMU9_ARUDO